MDFISFIIPDNKKTTILQNVYGSIKKEKVLTFVTIETHIRGLMRPVRTMNGLSALLKPFRNSL